MQNVLHTIREGMKVLDASNHEIGHVDWVQFGNDNPDTPVQEAETTEGMEENRETLLTSIVDAFRVDDLPLDVRERLLMQGFVRIDSEGLFAADRYVLPDQIAGVSGDALTLNVEKSDLMKRH